jgi:anaphase-promoting complex subunit 4
MASPISLDIASETKFDHRAPEGFPAACPTLDLSATWDSETGNLLIVRPKDQVVSKIHQLGGRGETPPLPQAVRWKPDG